MAVSGDLYLSVQVQIPERLTREERSRSYRLRALQPRSTATRPAPAATVDAQSTAR